MPSASPLRNHHVGTSMDLLRRRLRKLESKTIIAVYLRNEITATWKNTGEKEAEKQPTPRSAKNDSVLKLVTKLQSMNIEANHY